MSEKRADVDLIWGEMLDINSGKIKKGGIYERKKKLYADGVIMTLGIDHL